ncbi:MAG: hypothetical protein AUG74_10305 [Bacteroidetes bacterium 13_1_20CM_4_60_6]|nr:MAG: hypothetical protein AUG74_10305 [Bacteroidetes bacterium 13_1_20CM_4_60_6]
MLHRGPPGFDRLSRQVSAAAIDDGQGEEQGQLGRRVVGGHDRGLAVEGVEDRLDEEEVRTAVAQAARRLGVALAQLVERDGAIRGIVDLGRQRERHVGRAERAGDEPVLVAAGRRARDLRAGLVHLVDQAGELVVALGDRRGGEGVGRDDVGPGLEVVDVGLLNELGAGQVEDVDIVAQQL